MKTGSIIKKPWLYELDRGKGLAILLVVMGHVVARTPPLGADWYVLLKFTIYLFHMPFFVFVNGVAMSYSYREIDSYRGYVDYIKIKFFRFIPIFFILGIFILLGKELAEKFVQVDNGPANFITGVINLFLYPGLSPASTLWYIYVLFMYYLIFPLFANVKNNLLVYLIIIGSIILSLNSYRVTHLFLLERFSAYFCFAVLGWIVGKNYEVFLKFIQAWGRWLVLIFFLTILFVDAIFFNCIINHDCSYFPKFFQTIHAITLCGLVSIPALMFLLRFSIFSKSIWLEKIGKYVFVIYLLNTIIMGFVKGIGLKFLSWDNQNFLLYFPILLSCGIFIPILLKRYILPLFPKLDKATW
jgi:fucose 4-O-acetylase-like acetyltransferase